MQEPHEPRDFVSPVHSNLFTVTEFVACVGKVVLSNVVGMARGT